MGIKHQTFDALFDLIEWKNINYALEVISFMTCIPS